MAEQIPGVVRMGMIRRLPSLTPTQFSDHWSGPHGTIASHIPNLRRYHQNHVIGRFAIKGVADRWSLDGLSELWFDDIETMMRSIASPQYAPLAQDTPTVMTMPGLIAGRQEIVVQESVDASKLAKAMMVLGRDPALSAQSFTERWRNRSESLEQIQGLSSAVNTFVVHHESRPGEVISRSDLPVDAVCEIWFSNEEAMRSAFATEVPRLFAVSKEALIADAACYAMKTFVIVS
jgi:uncharacterized protein (TIGR02118 family)